ncbi:Putative pectinesterase/pectinesterase inhibitor 22 [Apostasia shenzhenica]|uniref:Pectinesterase n=1 Tax=Apostasia shenzhenica TaxID=1088818 RepID=A0A2I0B370_9ASPA|nr:Putative pectinesterase/pectinesterase inhibitor 22 [Apostasia shenzhenica]
MVMLSGPSPPPHSSSPMASASTALLLFLHLLLLRSLSSSTTLLSHHQPADEPFKTSLIHQACLGSGDFDACTARIYTECSLPDQPGPIPVLHAAIRGAINEALRSIETITSVAALSGNLRERTAITDCSELLDYSVHELGQSLADMTWLGGRHDADLRSWLSAALSNQDTCLEGFDGTDGRLRHYVRGSLQEVTQLVSNVMAVYQALRSILPRSPPSARGDSNAEGGGAGSELPPWIEEEDMELLHANSTTMRVDAVVAADGSGRFRSIADAVEKAPSHSSRRYVIFVKKGLYRENVELKKKNTNIMLVGEGMGATVVTGNRNFLQGWTTFRTATFAVSGPGFIARDITFRNTAGPHGRQAVALRVDSDRSAFFRCSIEGYQDTLYAHSLRQFYRECHIHGTIDFIFGNGQAVFQKCKIFARRPLPYQKVTVTAQGRKDPKQNTGFSIHNSFVYATYPTYLGRPWKAYSRTVFMQSYLGSGVQPRGWLEWAGNFGLSTLFYGEYMNYGPGSGLSGRVRWPGYHVIRDSAVAAFFTVRRFIDGVSWLPSTRVPFGADLAK